MSMLQVHSPIHEVTDVSGNPIFNVEDLLHDEHLVVSSLDRQNSHCAQSSSPPLQSEGQSIPLD